MVQTMMLLLFYFFYMNQSFIYVQLLPLIHVSQI